jgi:integrase/recombinase XerD
VDDEYLIRLWLHGRPATTRRAYAREIGRLRGDRPLAQLELADIQAALDRIKHLAPRSQSLAADAIRSFYGFHAKVGTLGSNPAAALTSPKIPSDLAERILSEADISKMLCAAPVGRDRVILRLLYTAGLRASELCGLRWRHAVARGDAGQLTVHGKGGKTRTVLLPASVWGDLAVIEPDDAKPGDPIFPSRRDPSQPLGVRQLLDIVKRAAISAGLTDKVSSHWLRHACASHALDHQAPISLVRDVLGHASVATTNRYLHSRPNEGLGGFLKVA